MAFHPTRNLVEYLFSPANISEIINEKAEKIAIEMMKYKFVYYIYISESLHKYPGLFVLSHNPESDIS